MRGERALEYAWRRLETGAKLISLRDLQCLNIECLNCIARIGIIPKIVCHMTAERYIFEGEGVCVERGGGKGDGMGCNSRYSDRATFFFRFLLFIVAI